MSLATPPIPGQVQTPEFGSPPLPYPGVDQSGGLGVAQDLPRQPQLPYPETVPLQPLQPIQPMGQPLIYSAANIAMLQQQQTMQGPMAPAREQPLPGSQPSLACMWACFGIGCVIPPVMWVVCIGQLAKKNGGRTKGMWVAATVVGSLYAVGVVVVMVLASTILQ